MFIKVRRDTIIILTLAFLLIVSGRVMSYMAFAESPATDQGIPISGVMIKGNNLVPTDSIRANIYASGLRPGSYINGSTLITDKRELPLNEAISNAQQFATLTTIPGTRLTPIVAADVKVDSTTGSVTVTVVEDWSQVVVNTTSSTTSSYTTG
ncbi:MULTISPECIES: hypothetical protein [Methanobacterium]|jgi:hypothetical protein|uniref:Uncharacterized protein n=1 Tax=Methanobacterium bryantii TaxID=2161 RepID=A0A2A2H9U0_METBR|nr:MULTISPECIES: hypothetical protein [Methanobacterium]OEC86961.1 hypothetical protein A9507_08610 [Methanobacterium sp. A39]PAV06023.1 hypothetical protein ASJ80_14355 [Methanobacterium bryantii]